MAKPTLFSLAGKKVWGASYKGSFVGPTLHLIPGTTVSLTLRNHLPVVSNLHFHGMHVSPSGGSDNPFLDVNPGTSFGYRLAIPAGHAPGTFWYHDHAMGMSAGATGSMATPTSGADVESEIASGLSGTIVVGDDRTLLPAALRNIAAQTMVFKDAQISAAGRIVQNTTTSNLDFHDPTVRFVNGQMRPVLTMQPGETQLWRLANEGADIFYRLHLDGSHFTVISHDGVPASRITTASTLLLPPGGRYDVLITAGPRPGSTWLRTLRFVSGGDAYPNTRLLALHVAGTARKAVAMPTGAMPTAPTTLANARIAQARTLRLSDQRGTMYINGQTFSATRSLFATPGVVNTVEEWTIVNTTDEIHPFHVHTNQFQIMSVNGTARSFTSVADIVPVPVPVPAHGRVVIRVKLADFTGRWMFHCHISAHENEGMMGYLNVVAPAASRTVIPPTKI